VVARVVSNNSAWHLGRRTTRLDSNN
jgi:hypothetical protein